MTDIPQGFRPLSLPSNPFVAGCGPLYGHVTADQQFVMGLRVERRHCNPGNMCHGGMLMTLADMTMLLGIGVQTGLDRYMLTVHLSTDFIAGAPLGSWIEGRVQVLRQTRNLVFAQGMLQVDGEPVARLSGLFKPLPEERTAPRRGPLFAD